MNVKLDITNQLKQRFPDILVDNLVESYLEMKSFFFKNEFRETALHGGRFSEIFIRLIEFITTNSFTPLSNRLPTFHDLVVSFANYQRNMFHDSIRIDIPRALDVIYNVRNKRNVGHVSGDLDENKSDAILSLYLCSWCLVELLRIYYSGTHEEAQELVDKLMKLNIPIIQDFDGFLKILDTELSVADKIMSVAIYKNVEGFKDKDLYEWLSIHDKSYINKVLKNLIDKKAFLHYNKIQDTIYITLKGTKYVSEKINLNI